MTTRQPIYFYGWWNSRPAPNDWLNCFPFQLFRRIAIYPDESIRASSVRAATYSREVTRRVFTAFRK